MKQILVGLGVLIAFIVYSLGVRHEQTATVKTLVTIKPPTSSGGTTTPPTGKQVPLTGQYKNGTFTGTAADAFYGNVQVAAVISGGRISDVRFLEYPTDHPDSIMINQDAAPQLTQEAIQKQSAQVDVISGATFTSQAFIQSLTNALSQAKL